MVNRRKTLLRRGIAATATALALAAVALPGDAQAAPDPRYADADEHYAGSQIALYEQVTDALPPAPDAQADQVLGHDVSGHQPGIDWTGTAGKGAKFAYIKATEGTGYVNPLFAPQYNGSYAAGMIRGAYHFARPDVSSGADQANYFVDHGGGWSKDGRTLPGALDAEYNPYGDTCYGKNPADLTAWIRDFVDTYARRTGRPPAIYTSTSWWKKCTGNADGFGADPLWIARYNSFVGTLPASWHTQSIWQFANGGALPGDQDRFNGGLDQLHALSLG